LTSKERWTVCPGDIWRDRMCWCVGIRDVLRMLTDSQRLHFFLTFRSYWRISVLLFESLNSAYVVLFKSDTLS
jgi:hypothetical protein